MAKGEEYPPLLNDGFKQMSVPELRELVVDGFPLSKRRADLWSTFVSLLDKITESGLPCLIWVDGSFLTQKIDPCDIDFVVDFPIESLERATQDQLTLIDALSRRTAQQPRHKGLHSWVMFTAPPGHNFHLASQESHAQWSRDFGRSYAKGAPKGIAVIEVRQ